MMARQGGGEVNERKREARGSEYATRLSESKVLYIGLQVIALM
jgi:hypothetical protein